MSDQICDILLSDIDTTDCRYRISTDQPDIDNLALSLNMAGLITPILVRSGRSLYRIISGFNRVAACQHLKKSSIPAVVLSDEISDAQCAVNAVCALSLKRELTSVELIRSLTLLCLHFTTKQICEKSTALFGSHLSGKSVKELTRISKLPDPSLDLIENGGLSLKAAKKLIQLDQDTIASFLGLFSKIRASASVQQEVIVYMCETAKREGISVNELFDKAGIERLTSDKTIDPKEKASQLRLQVFKLRFPHLADAQKKVASKISAMKLDARIRIEPPPYFEGRKYRVVFSAEDEDQFKGAVRQLDHSIKTGRIKDLFDL